MARWERRCSECGHPLACLVETSIVRLVGSVYSHGFGGRRNLGGKLESQETDIGGMMHFGRTWLTASAYHITGYVGSGVS